MELETEGLLVQKCREIVEEQLGWGNGEQWSSQDFQALSDKIMEKTQVRLSPVTLKRIWGAIKYDSRPTVTTLNALAQFVGFENWRDFRVQNGVKSNGYTGASDEAPPRPGRSYKKLIFGGTAGAIVIAVTLAFVLGREPSPNLNPDDFEFSSKKVVDTGVPNTVIFDYDASSAAPTDSVFIQQTWDIRLSRQVSADQKQHTSIYYMPGFFRAKLRINDKVMKEHTLYIKSGGWIGLVEQQPVPVYYRREEFMKSGFMGLDATQVLEKNIALQPTPGWMGFYNVGDVADILTDDFIFETEVKNEYDEGAAACQHSEVHVLFEGATLVIPLCIPGCVSELKFLDLDGKKSDLSAFGVDFKEWVKVKAEVKDTIGRVFVNDRKADEFIIKMQPAKFVGMIFRFQGTGSVNRVRISRHDGEVVYDEGFDEQLP